MNKVYCPYCKKEVRYTIEKRDIMEFKGVSINTYENVAICIDCKSDLYVNKLEEENSSRIYEAYRNKVNLITPNDIINFRNEYSLSQRELTTILEFGKMTINRYERGGIPTKSQSDYIKLLINNRKEFFNKVEEAYNKGNIGYKTYEKVVSFDKSAILRDMQSYSKEYINFSLSRKPSIFNGYKSFDINLVENILSYIASKVKNLTITSMNKYLWYIDMLAFNKNGIGITGITYQKQQYGPTIADWKYDDISKLNDKYSRQDFEDENGNLSTIITSKNNFDLSELEEWQKDIIDEVIKLLKNKKVKEISEMSHKEDGWKKTKLLDNISFEYALSLNITK